MALRKKARRAKVITQQTLEQPLGHAKAQLCTVEIDNPLYSRAHDGAVGNPKTISAKMNLRESPIAMMFARGHLAEYHLMAANKFRKLWETMGGAGAGSFDYSKEPVDGGAGREPLTDAQIDAGRELTLCQIVIGRRQYELVRLVAGQGYSISNLYAPKRERNTKADNLRDALEDLAKHWGMMTNARVL